MGELWPVLWQGALLAPLLLVLGALGVVAWYRLAWATQPRWREAMRHAFLLRTWLDRWIYFRWIHHDCQYWVLTVRLDKGPLELVGRPIDAPYWSITWYASPETHASLSCEQIQVDDDGRYRVRLGGPQQPGNWLPGAEGARRALIYIRAYEPRAHWPVPMPEVHQAGRVLAVGGDR